MYTLFKTDLINHSDYVHILGTQPASVILSLKKFRKVENDTQKCQNKLKPKEMV